MLGFDGNLSMIEQVALKKVWALEQVQHLHLERLGYKSIFWYLLCCSHAIEKNGPPPKMWFKYWEQNYEGMKSFIVSHTNREGIKILLLT